MTRDERYGVSVIDPRVTSAFDALSGISDEVLRSLFCAVYAFEQDKDPGVLIKFAEDAAITARLYAAPGHDHHKAMAAAAAAPATAGRDVREVFVDLRG